MLYLPYGKTSIPFDETGATVLHSRVDELVCCKAGGEIVRAAMERPIGSERLSVLASGKRNCVIIISDHTRPVPSKDILPAMLYELRQGNPAIEITLLVATGCHRGTTKAELNEKLGETIVASERIVVHDAADASANVGIGTLPSGAPLVIDRLAANADLLIAEGFIEPHFFAGYSGGRKSVLPGVCDRVTVLGNHCSRFIDSGFARAGILEGNPIHTDMIAAARMAKLSYIVNVVINEQKQTVAVFAGDPVQAHLDGCAFLRPYCEVETRSADIVITTNGGAPLDQNVYQCVKGLSTAESAANPGGVLILLAECADGVGGEGFHRSLRDCESPRALYDSILATPQQQTISDQWQSQILARILIKHTVIFVTRGELAETIRQMKMEYAPSLGEALKKARALKGADASLTVIPNGVSMIVRSVNA
ncbi:MAG TPA: nickel-dependent lactate racemase [Candidatus Cryosericum sp.]|nr:nickel-dependent lactate racemase [Candidatus Cryosericum sp.]